MSAKHITLVVLAAGEGKRFWPFRTQKIMFPFFEKPLIDFSFPQTLPESISECVFVANPATASYFRDRTWGVPHTVVVQDDANGMAGAIEAAKEVIRGKRILVLIADDVADEARFSSVIKAAKSGVSGVLTVWKPQEYFPGGYIEFSGGAPVGIQEKPPKDHLPSEYVYFGGQYIERADDLVAQIAQEKKTGGDDMYERAITALMKKGRFELVVCDSPFVSLKYPWHVLSMLEYLLIHRLKPGRGKRVDIRNNVSIEGPVYIGNDVKIFENTKIIGPCYIGDGTIIGNSNIIRESYIGPGCVTGFNSDITRSYIGANCWFHSNYVGDSVLESDVSMGSGTVCANLRLDEGMISSTVSGKKIDTGRTKLGALIGTTVRIGVNTSTMPGIKIGANSAVGAGLIVSQDVPESSFCSMKGELSIVKNTRPVTTDRNAYKTKI